MQARYMLLSCVHLCMCVCVCVCHKSVLSETAKCTDTQTTPHNRPGNPFLAPLANLPTRLYILPSVISSFLFIFFTMSKAISVPTGPIFKIFSPGICVNFLDLVQFFSDSSREWQPILWQNCSKITYPLHLSLCHSEKEWDIATSIYALTA